MATKKTVKRRGRPKKVTVESPDQTVLMQVDEDEGGIPIVAEIVNSAALRTQRVHPSDKEYLIFEMALATTKAMVESGSGKPSETLAKQVADYSRTVVEEILNGG